jgi:hypothetical protein
VINRREFLESIAAAVPALAWQENPASEWGSSVFDLHFHLRPRPTANLAHLDGAGVTKANLLTRGAVLEQVKALQAIAPGRFTWFNSRRSIRSSRPIQRPRSSGTRMRSGQTSARITTTRRRIRPARSCAAE